MSVLSVRDVEVVYRHRGRPPVRAVAGASLEVERGQVVGLVGESGCGKSSLARAAVGLVAPEAGEIVLDGKPLQPLRRRARTAEEAKAQMVFQNPHASLNPRRTIGSQIGDGFALTGVPADQRLTRAGALLEEVGIPPGAVGRYPHQFSGGQLQRIAIARALAAEPSVIVLDEPLSSLDASAQALTANLLVRLARERGLALLLISHDLGIVHHVADVVSVMYLGVVVETAPTRELWRGPRHPYTQSLIAAVPRADGSGTLPATLPGEVPDPARPPSGCRFHPRCPRAYAPCAVEVPTLFPAGPDRHAACFLVRDGADA